LHRFERKLGSSLLTSATTTARAEHLDVELGHQAFDLEFLIVCGAVRSDHVVLRQRDLLALQVFLQQRFRILAQRFRVDSIENRDVQRTDHVTRNVETAIQVDRAKQRFQRIGQNGWTAKTTGFQFALAQSQELRELKALRDLI
jgi:hypothetical protein